MEATEIYFSNVITTMGVVEKLERLDSAKDISMKLELRCKDVAITYLKSANILSKFVRDNCNNMAHVIRLLQNCDGLLPEPQPPVIGLHLPPANVQAKCTHVKVKYQGSNRYYCRKCFVDF
jgi:hypothetical protein